MEVRRNQHLEALKALFSSFRYVVCVDLEATCDDYPEGLTGAEKSTYPLLVTPDEMETIEVGAVVLDLHACAEKVGEFTRFIRPILKPILTPFCIGLTTITQSDVEAAASYDQVRVELEAFLDPFKDGGYMWCSWGAYDAKQLELDATRLGCKAMFAGIDHTNLKKWHWKIHHCRAMGLQAAVKAHGIDWQGQCHRGIDDALNLGSLLRNILNQ